MINMRRFVVASSGSKSCGVVSRSASCTGELMARPTPRLRERYRSSVVLAFVCQPAILPLDTSRGVEGLALRNPGNHRQSHRREGANSRRCVAGFALFATRDTAKTRAKEPNGCQSSAVQGVQGPVSAGGAVRLR